MRCDFNLHRLCSHRIINFIHQLPSSFLSNFWWDRPDLNRRPRDPKSRALTKLSYCPMVPGLSPAICATTLRDFGGELVHAVLSLRPLDRIADGGAYRIRTGPICLEGRCATTDTNAPYSPHPASGEPPFTGRRHFLWSCPMRDWWFRPGSNRELMDYEPIALPFELRNHNARAVCTRRAAFQGRRPIYDRRLRRYPSPLEGGAEFEPAASRCAASVLPEAPPAHAAATRAAMQRQLTS